VRDIRRIVCGSGPGSFTSLRIAASIAKGLAVGTGATLHAVPSLALIVAANVRGAGSGERYIARLDALRGESYLAEYIHDAGRVSLVRDLGLVADGNVGRLATGFGARIVGPGEEEAWHPHVRGLQTLDAVLFEKPVNLAEWEPLYGRRAEAQVKWEAEHGRALGS